MIKRYIISVQFIYILYPSFSYEYLFSIIYVFLPSYLSKEATSINLFYISIEIMKIISEIEFYNNNH